MADTQNTIYGLDFSRNIMAIAQQEKSVTYDKCYKTTANGKMFSQDQIGEWSMQQMNGRAPATPENDPLFGRRWGIVCDYHDNRIIGREDALKTLSDPKSAMTQSASRAIGRKYDDVNIAALVGTAYYGETGSSSIALPTAQKIAVGSGPMTIAKLREAKRKLDSKNVEQEDRFLLISAQGLEDLLADTYATDAQYVGNVKAMVDGTMGRLFGFNFIMSTRLPLSSTTRSCIAFQKWGLCLGEAGGAMVRTSERDDKSYMWQVYYALSCGATRLEENRVVQIDITEVAE